MTLNLEGCAVVSTPIPAEYLGIGRAGMAEGEFVEQAVFCICIGGGCLVATLEQVLAEVDASRASGLEGVGTTSLVV